MRCRTFKIGDLFFGSTAELDKFVLALPHTYTDAVKKGHGDLKWQDFVFVCEIIAQQHPDALNKIGSGIVGAYYVPDDFGGLTLMLKRQEGDTSVCLRHLRKNPLTYKRDKAVKAFRDAIRPQMQVKVEEAFAESVSRSCPITGQPFSRQEAEVDHQPPEFKTLVESFAGPLHEVQVIDVPTGGVKLPNEEAWQQYHATNANLLVVSYQGHKEVTKLRRTTVR